ncbi:MAG: hypothetical protein AB1744_11600, partial [Candidatus Zixiibacteriota bacterium]
AYGLKTRIIFTPDTVRADEDEVVTSSGASVDFALEPQEILLDDVELGAICDVEEKTGIVLKVTNSGEREQTFKLQSHTVGGSLASLPDEYDDTPDASYLRFSESEFALPPNGTKSVRMYLEFPSRPEYSGKRYMFVIHALTVDEHVTTGVYSRLYASTR